MQGKFIVEHRNVKYNAIAAYKKGRTSTVTYDPRGSNRVTTYTYDGNSNVATATYANSYKSTFTYDAGNRTTQQKIENAATPARVTYHPTTSAAGNTSTVYAKGSYSVINGSAPVINSTTLHSELFYHRNMTENQNTIALSSDRGSLEIAGVSLLYEGSRVKSYLLGRDLNPMGRGDGSLYAQGMFSAGNTRPVPNARPIGGRGNSVNNINGSLLAYEIYIPLPLDPNPPMEDKGVVDDWVENAAKNYKNPECDQACLRKYLRKIREVNYGLEWLDNEELPRLEELEKTKEEELAELEKKLDKCRDEEKAILDELGKLKDNHDKRWHDWGCEVYTCDQSWLNAPPSDYSIREMECRRICRSYLYRKNTLEIKLAEKRIECFNIGIDVFNKNAEVIDVSTARNRYDTEWRKSQISDRTSYEEAIYSECNCYPNVDRTIPTHPSQIPQGQLMSSYSVCLPRMACIGVLPC